LRQVNLNAAFAALTLDIIGLSGFGYNFHALEVPDSDIRHAYDNLLPPLSLKLVALRLLPFLAKIPFLGLTAEKEKAVRRRCVDCLCLQSPHGIPVKVSCSG
jgi:hypothetical protein